MGVPGYLSNERWEFIGIMHAYIIIPSSNEKKTHTPSLVASAGCYSSHASIQNLYI